MQKKHFFLACGQVVWRKSADAEEIQVMPANAIASFDQPYIRQFNLSQLNAQMINNLSTIIGEEIDPTLVAGVTLLSLNSLGHMTEEEFRAIPKGMQVEREVREVVEGDQ